MERQLVRLLLDICQEEPGAAWTRAWPPFGDIAERARRAIAEVPATPLTAGLLAAVGRAATAYERRNRFVHDLHGVVSTGGEARLVRLERTRRAQPIQVEEGIGAIALAAEECWYAGENIRILRDRAAAAGLLRRDSTINVPG
jgi:hypothetical protein